MTDTANLGLPFIDGAQAQKHVTHNEALRILDAAIQIAVADRTRTAPPASPAEGERHIVASGATAAWSGRANAIATWQDGAWAYLAPKQGWCVWSVADNLMLVFDGAAWRDARAMTIDNLTRLGINTVSDSSNLLSVRSNAALLSAIPVGGGGNGDVRLQVSKEATARTASVFFSNNYSGRAEFGLIGGDAFKLKVSADGSAWSDALSFNLSGGATFASTLSVGGLTTISGGVTLNTPTNSGLTIASADGTTTRGILFNSGSQITLGTQTNHPFVVFTNNVARATLAASGEFTLASTTASASPATGALTVAGGAGIGGALNVGGAIAGASASIAGNVAALGSVSGNSASFNTDITAGKRIFLGTVAIGSENAVFNSGSTDRLTLYSGSSAYRFVGLGAGTLTSDATGNVSVTSDETLKIIHGGFTRGLADLKGIRPILHSWREDSGMETAGIYAGFSAQNVQGCIPEAVGRMADGKLTLSDRPLFAVLINAVNELSAQVEALRAGRNGLAGKSRRKRGRCGYGLRY